MRNRETTMNKAIDHTIETVTEGTPEVGNLASVLGLKHDSADYGIVTEVVGQEVKVAWFKKVLRCKRAHRENKNNRAADRVVAAQVMDAVNAQYEA